MDELEKEVRQSIQKALDQIHNENLTEADALKPQFKVSHSRDFMTLNKYISNPTGKGSAYVAKRSAIKDGLNLTYIKLLRESRRQFYAQPYIYGNGDVLYYVKVPSEFYKENKISYDVLFLIKYDKQLERKNRQIFMYSNSPSFIFTYCYVYNKHGLLIDKLLDKFPREALTMPPDVRNPIQSLGFEKSTYIAAKYLIDGGCLSDGYLNRFGKTMNSNLETLTFNKIVDPEKLVAIYQYAQYNSRKTHKKELSANEKAAKDKEKRDYETTQKKIRPKEGFIFHKSPRSKITAKKAVRNLLNDKNKKD